MRLVVGPKFYFGHIEWMDGLEMTWEGNDINWGLPLEIKESDSLIELLLLLEGVRILGLKTHV